MATCSDARVYFALCQLPAAIRCQCDALVPSSQSTLWYAGSGDSGLNHQSWRMNLMELDNALGASSARWKIVVGHHPVYSYSSHG